MAEPITENCRAPQDRHYTADTSQECAGRSSQRTALILQNILAGGMVKNSKEKGLKIVLLECWKSSNLLDVCSCFSGVVCHFFFGMDWKGLIQWVKAEKSNS
ncbi:hypothetical protein CDAR_7951 [Caerostris darwini]|uniref:Uncharacterized protein n=1 Tax=Caerostris darwini TaxID=1538125 RepID=A0AAV4Q7Q3_9ARAC|nr:hypothetical protein CDAR_7951 [Caerostris darwini]